MNVPSTVLRASASLLLATLASPAWADTSAADRAAADALFKEGRALVKDGKYAEGCPKLAASQKLDPAAGTLLALGDCYELNGQTASAWATFQDAGAFASKIDDAARADEAKRRADALGPKLSKLAIQLAAGAERDGLEVRRDGKLVDGAELGTPIPVDPGEHAVEATAPDAQPWSTKVQIGAGAGVTTVSVPVLASASTGVAAPSASEEPDFWSTQRTVGLVVGGVGVVGLAIGAAFGGVTLSKVAEAEDGHCGESVPPCDETGRTLHEEANTSANVSNVALALGGAALIAGVVVFATADAAEPSSQARLKLRAGPGGLGLNGTW